MNDTWETIEALCEWLDEESPVTGQTARLLRILKIGEEFGEVAEAVHGLLGTNPRKGRTHTADDVCKELCDVIATSMVALASVTEDPGVVFDARLREIADRAHRASVKRGPA
ncbi:MazG-like family protein [Streptomyces synnematoformans]|uniref:MazG-like family protein n=1 Tax=Streptomyces synnematoformans TaxID=415721 RepID=A0ABN2YZY4_9ACTN